MGSASSPAKTILDCIEEGLPLALVLGQSINTSRSGQDPLLSLSLNKLGRTVDLDRGWPALIGATGLAENFYEWLAERFQRCPAPVWLESIAQLPWSAIFTSSVDPTLATRFASANREPQVVLTGTEIPIVARSTSRTPLYYLFGRAGVSDTAALPPRDRSALRVRTNSQAIPILNRLPEIATPLGVVVVDCVSIDRDWLTLDPLLAAIEQMPSGRVVWCGLDDKAIDSNESLKYLVTSGHVLAPPQSLGEVVAELSATGRLDDVVPARPTTAGTISFESGQSISLSPEIRIRVEAVASIVDDSWKEFLNPLGAEAEYLAFRHFHGGGEGPRSLVQGVRYGFAIDRDYETKLASIVESAIGEHAKFSDPILVHGQSSTGKTIALARLVAGLVEASKSAVLYTISRVPLSSEIDAFCELVEQAGAPATVIVCDCNAAVVRYRELLLSLRSRGRKVVVVGSSYRLVDSNTPPGRTSVVAPETLSEGERARLTSLLTKYSDGSEIRVGHDRNVLATLYRVLPPSRLQIAMGLSGEARAAEQSIRERGARPQSRRYDSQLAIALVAAGIATESDQILDELIADSLSSADDSAGRLVDLVMVAGRLNCPVPVNLLMRAVTSANPRSDFATIAAVFEGLDLFRWRKVDGGPEDLFVSPRLTLEADLLCRRRLLNAAGEGAQLIKLIEAARLSWDPGGSERRFLIELIQKLGPDGPLGNRYRESYLAIARTLTGLRSRFGTNDPNVMLQESVLRRSAIREGAVRDPEQLLVLEEAREAVQSAMDQLGNQTGRGARRTRANLSVERATIYGFLANYKAQRSESPEEIWSAYEAARVAAKAATAVSDTYFPFDVSLWVPADLAESEALGESKRLELIADIHSVLDRIDPNAFPREQREKFNRRLYNIGEQLQFPHLSQRAFAQLEADGSTAGYYLRARNLGPGVQQDAEDTISQSDRARAEEAARFLMANWEKIKGDERSLRYLLQCEWIVAVGRRLMRGERAPLPFGDQKRQLLLRLVKVLNEVTISFQDNALRYLEAVLSWLVNDEQHAQAIWRELARETDFVDSRRVIRRHLLTDADGNPILFSGRVEVVSGENRFVLRVNEIGRRIQLLGRDFPGVDLAYGRTVPAFAIGFNFIGPIADPSRRAGG